MSKKILFIYGPLNAGGAERVLLDFLKNLDRNKYDISLCQTISGGKLFNELPNDIKLISLCQNYNLYYKIAYRASIWLGNDFLFKRVIQKKIKENYDVVISFLEGMPLKIHTLIDSNAKNITWVHIDLDNFRYTESNFFRKKEREAYMKMDEIICVSQDTKNAFLKRFSGIENTVSTIYNPIDILTIKKLAENEDRLLKDNVFKIVIVGRLTFQKKIERVVEVAAKFLNYNIPTKFFIVGDGELKKELQFLVKKFQVEHLVEFVGYQSNPYPYIKNADLLLSTSAYEGFGLVLCEAMALGTPVVSTKTAGPTEIIGANEFGLLCDHSIESIFEALKTMIESEELRNCYIQKGFERVKEYSLENALNQFDQLIDTIK